MLDTLIGFVTALISRVRSPRAELRADVAAVIEHSERVVAEWERLAVQLRADTEALRADCVQERDRGQRLESSIALLRQEQRQCERDRRRDAARISALEQELSLLQVQLTLLDQEPDHERHPQPE